MHVFFINMGKKKRKQRNFSSSSSEGSFIQTPMKKQSTVLGYFAKIEENNTDIMENKLPENEIKDMQNSENNIHTNATDESEELDIDTMSNRDMLKLIIKDIRDIKLSLQYQGHEITDLKKKVGALEQNSRKQEYEITSMKSKIRDLEQAQIDAECYNKRMNLIIRNVDYSENEDVTKKVRDIFSDTLHIQNANDITFESIHRLKRDNNAIIMRFSRFEDRQLIWRARANLKDTTYKMHEHYPREIEANRRRILPVYIHAKRAHKEGTVLYRDEITFKGNRYTIRNIDSLAEQVGMSNLGARYDDRVYLFFGKMSHLSNFHYRPFEYEGRTLNCVEQGYQAEKANFAGRPDIAQSVHSMTDPVQMKRAGDCIPNDEWYDSGRAVSTMKKLLVAKFTQCSSLRKTLLNTGNRVLVESSPTSLFWGSGLHIGHRDALNTDVYKGHNHMGQLLADVRESIKA